jgi:hypothetical protein
METLGIMISRISSKNQTHPMGASIIDKKTLRRLAMDFYLDEETLYEKSFYETLLRCLGKKW